MNNEKDGIVGDLYHTPGKNKSILLICANFFGYDKRICRALLDQGYEVDMIDEKPNSSFLIKACIRYNVAMYRPEIRKYYRKFIQQSGDKEYDYIIVVKGEAVNEEIIDLLREAYPAACLVLYLWDSIANIPDCEKRMRLYDRVLTFDPQDAKDYQLIFRPLFFGKEYGEQPREGGNYKYDFSFIGTAHTVRPRIVKQLEKSCIHRSTKAFSYLFLPHPIVYFYNKVFNRDYRGIQKKDIKFQSLKAEEIIKIYRDSRCILDIEHQRQRGLTMRTIELVGMQKKIITTNAEVKVYDFYNPKNICVIDRKNPVLDQEFLETTYEDIPEDIYRKYSVAQWVLDVLGIGNEGE